MVPKANLNDDKIIEMLEANLRRERYEDMIAEIAEKHSASQRTEATRKPKSVGEWLGELSAGLTDLFVTSIAELDAVPAFRSTRNHDAAELRHPVVNWVPGPVSRINDAQCDLVLVWNGAEAPTARPNVNFFHDGEPLAVPPSKTRLGKTQYYTISRPRPARLAMTVVGANRYEIHLFSV